MNYIILSQRIDIESDYKDIPFLRYHFPKRYRSQINVGDKFIYNQGNRYNKDHRYYFGYGIIGQIWMETSGDHFFAEIINGKRFSSKVQIHDPKGGYLESINYEDVREKEIPPFRSSIRPVSKAAFEKILDISEDYKIIDRSLLQNLIIEALENSSGSADIVTVCKYVWKNYEFELRASGDLLYTWQYDIRWAATNLRESGEMKSTVESPTGIWELNS